MNGSNQKLYEYQSEIIQAIGHPVRLAILDFLKNGEMCVCDIARKVGHERSNVSRHLSVMLKAGVLGVRKEGLKMIYELKTPCLLNFLSCVSDVVRNRIEEDAKVLKDL